MEWATPDAGDPSRPPAPPPPTARPPAALDRRPSLGPMTVPDILDHGFAVLRRAPATVFGVTAAFAVPLVALGAWLTAGGEGLDLEQLIEQSDTSFQVGGTTSSTSGAWVLQLGPMVALVFVAAAIARLTSAWAVGHDLGPRELLRVTLGRTWPLLASFVLVHVLELVSAIGIVLPLAVMTLFLVTAPVIGAEGLGPIAAMQRSARLVRRSFWRVLGLALLCFLVEQLFAIAVAFLPSLLTALLGTDGLGWVLAAAATFLTQMVTLPLVGGITVAIYLDLRVRSEGLDLELAAMDAFPSLPPPPS